MSRSKEQAEASVPKKRRADAEHSINSILAAAFEALASDPDVSMAEIARRAGVVRATIYMHFPTRESLLDAVMDYAIADVVETIATTEPDKDSASQALERILVASWQKLDRMHALISVNSARLSSEEFHRRHMPFIAVIAPVIERGKKQGAFRADLPTAWHLSMLLAIVHAASGEVRSERIAESQVEEALLSTAMNTLKPK